MTALNVYFIMTNRYGKTELVTPMDNGCIVAGVTRQSILALSNQIKRETGIEVVERNVSIHEVLNAYNEQRLIEVISSSTASHI